MLAAVIMFTPGRRKQFNESQNPTYELPYSLLLKRNPSGIQNWSYRSEPTNCKNLPASSWTVQNVLVICQSSQHKMNEPSCSISWQFSADSDTGPCWFTKDIRLLSIMLSLSTMTYSLIWTAFCELLLRWWLNRTNTYTSPWSLQEWSCSNIIL
jgi:hypothetical protein